MTSVPNPNLQIKLYRHWLPLVTECPRARNFPFFLFFYIQIARIPKESVILFRSCKIEISQITGIHGPGEPNEQEKPIPFYFLVCFPIHPILIIF